jgi:hypothetical protein
MAVSPRVPAAALAVAVTTLVAACGVPTDDAAEVADPGDVPFGLLDQATTTTVAGAARPGTGPTVRFCLARVDEVVPVTRNAGQIPGAGDDLAALAEIEPSDDEMAAGLSSALPDVRDVVDVEVDAGVAVADLDPVSGELPGDRQLLAVAQIVCTLTSQPGIGQVRFTLDGEAVEVPRQDGSLSDDPVTRDDYATMISP